MLRRTHDDHRHLRRTVVPSVSRSEVRQLITSLRRATLIIHCGSCRGTAYGIPCPALRCNDGILYFWRKKAGSTACMFPTECPNRIATADSGKPCPIPCGDHHHQIPIAGLAARGFVQQGFCNAARWRMRGLALGAGRRRNLIIVRSRKYCFFLMVDLTHKTRMMIGRVYFIGWQRRSVDNY